MKTLTLGVFVSAAMTLGLSGVAQANDHEDHCSLRTLRGTYAFTASGFNIVGGVAQPKALVEVIDLNGDGTLSLSAATVAINGAIIRSLPGGLGTYTLEEGCTGTLAFAAGPTFDIFTSPNGKEIWMIQTNPNTVFQGTATRTPRDRDRR